jgi:hypothetical protein
VLLAHIGPLLEPLAFLPAYLVVGWAVAREVRRRSRERRHHSQEVSPE